MKLVRSNWGEIDQRKNQRYPVDRGSRRPTVEADLLQVLTSCRRCQRDPGAIAAFRGTLIRPITGCGMPQTSQVPVVANLLANLDSESLGSRDPKRVGRWVQHPELGVEREAEETWRERYLGCDIAQSIRQPQHAGLALYQQ